MKNTDIKAFKRNYLQLSKLGSAFGLSFSSHVVLGNRIIGLDGIKRKLLLSEINNGLEPPCIIELENVCTISVKKIYRSIPAGELKKRSIEEFLESINLQFEFRDGKDPIGLPFYENGVNEASDLFKLEGKARSWQTILSKMTDMQKSENNFKKQFQFENAGGTV